MEPQEQITILLSAAAVHVSFGLKQYVLPFFKDIPVVADAYDAIDSKEKYIGHVAPTGIYIAWKYFLQALPIILMASTWRYMKWHMPSTMKILLKKRGRLGFRKHFEKLPAVFGLW